MGELYNSLLPLGRKKLLYRRFFEDKTTMGESCNTTPFFISYLFCTLEFNTNEAILVEIVHYFLFMHSFHPTVLFDE